MFSSQTICSSYPNTSFSDRSSTGGELVFCSRIENEDHKNLLQLYERDVLSDIKIEEKCSPGRKAELSIGLELDPLKSDTRYLEVEEHSLEEKESEIKCINFYKDWLLSPVTYKCAAQSAAFQDFSICTSASCMVASCHTQHIEDQDLTIIDEYVQEKLGIQTINKQETDDTCIYIETVCPATDSYSYTKQCVPDPYHDLIPSEETGSTCIYTETVCPVTDSYTDPTQCVEDFNHDLLKSEGTNTCHIKLKIADPDTNIQSDIEHGITKNNLDCRKASFLLNDSQSGPDSLMSDNNLGLRKLSYVKSTNVRSNAGVNYHLDFNSSYPVYWDTTDVYDHVTAVYPMADSQATVDHGMTVHGDTNDLNDFRTKTASQSGSNHHFQNVAGFANSRTALLQNREQKVLTCSQHDRGTKMDDIVLEGPATSLENQHKCIRKSFHDQSAVGLDSCRNSTIKYNLRKKVPPLMSEQGLILKNKEMNLNKIKYVLRKTRKQADISSKGYRRCSVINKLRASLSAAPISLLQDGMENLQKVRKRKAVIGRQIKEKTLKPTKSRRRSYKILNEKGKDEQCNRILMSFSKTDKNKWNGGKCMGKQQNSLTDAKKRVKEKRNCNAVIEMWKVVRSTSSIVTRSISKVKNALTFSRKTTSYEDNCIKNMTEKLKVKSEHSANATDPQYTERKNITKYSRSKKYVTSGGESGRSHSNKKLKVSVVSITKNSKLRMARKKSQIKVKTEEDVSCRNIHQKYQVKISKNYIENLSLAADELYYEKDKTLLCVMCNYSATQKTSILVHTRRHTGEKPFKCSFCEYASVEKSHVVRHSKIHTGERPHRCPMCDYSCIQKVSLKAHLLHHHHQ